MLGIGAGTGVGQVGSVKLYGCGIIFAEAPCFPLKFPKKDSLKFYGWMSQLFFSKVNIYQLTKGKGQTFYVQAV